MNKKQLLAKRIKNVLLNLLIVLAILIFNMLFIPKISSFFRSAISNLFKFPSQTVVNISLKENIIFTLCCIVIYFYVYLVHYQNIRCKKCGSTNRLFANYYEHCGEEIRRIEYKQNQITEVEALE